MSLYKPRHSIVIEVPKNSRYATDETVIIEPLIVESTWTRNDHLQADTLEIVVDARDAGIDVRQLRNARCAFYLYDAASADLDTSKHLRFTGILMRPERELREGSTHAKLVFHDWTQLFLEKKQYPTDGIPDWTDTLPQAWAKICDHTGYWDPDSGAIVSSVEALRERLVFDDTTLANVKIGDAVPARFRAVSKPTPPHNADAWKVWQWLVGALGLVSWIDRDTCRVARVQDHFKETAAPTFLWGHNVLSLHEDTDAKITSKGVLLRSFNPLTGQLLEAHYPPTGDPRVKHRRVRVSSKPRTGGMSDPLADFTPYNFPACSDVDALEKRAQDVYEQMSRQDLKGRITTAEMVLPDGTSILDLQPGDSIRVEIDRATREAIASLGSFVTPRPGPS